MKTISRRDVLKAGGAAVTGSLLLPVSASAASGQYEIKNLTATWVIQGHPSQSAFGTTIDKDGKPIELRVPAGQAMKGQVDANDKWISFFAWKGGFPHVALTAAHLLGSPDGDFVVTVTEQNGKLVVDAPEVSGWYRWKQPLLDK